MPKNKGKKVSFTMKKSGKLKHKSKENEIQKCKKYQ